jgi:hypothetical protein
MGTYIYPQVKEKHEDFEFLLENHRIKIKAEIDKIEERVLVFVDNELHMKITDDNANIKRTIDLYNHKIFIHFKIRDTGNWLINDLLKNALMFPDGLYVVVDGKPLEGTLADPTRSVKFTSIGYYFFAGFAIISILGNKNLFAVYITVAVIAFVFALLSKKKPVIFLPLGMVWGVLELIGYFKIISENPEPSRSSTSSFMLLFFILLRVGIILSFIKGFIGIIQANSLKRGKLLKME